LWQGSHGLVGVLGQLVAVVCLVFALLAGGDMYKRKIVRIVGPALSDKKTTVQILADINRQIAAFLWARVVISTAVGVAVWVVFGVLGLEEPAVWGILAALLFTVPIVGPLLMVLGAGVAGFLHAGSIGLAAAAAGLTSLIGIIEGYVLTPLLMSRVGEMNAAAVFVSLMFWGWIWGIWGLLLAVPMTAAIKAVCDRVDNFNGFAELLKAETGGSHE
jgi:predicted PurR-regulated permease PerM